MNSLLGLKLNSIAAAAILACLASHPVRAQYLAVRERADQGAVAPADLTARPPAEGERMLKAYAWSIAGTALPITAAYLMASQPGGDAKNLLAGTLGVAGLLVGPSLGQMYAGSYGQSALGIGIRSTGGLIGLAGVAKMLSTIMCTDNDDEYDTGDSCSERASSGERMFWVGVATYAGGALYSLIDTRFAVERQSMRIRDGEFGWAPTLEPGPEGGLKPGAMAWMRF